MPSWAVSLECAQALKAAGFPQDGLQMRHRRWSSEQPWLAPIRLERPYKHKSGEDYAAPDPLTALDWLEKEKDWQWGKNHGPIESTGCWYAYGPVAEEEMDGIELVTDTADALIIAICARLSDA